MTALLVGIGILVGCVQVITGAGGSIVALPLLLLVTGMSVQAATPIALMAAAVAAGVATLATLPSGQVRYKAALLIALFGWLTSPLGVWLAQHISSDVLACLFALVMLRNAVAFWGRYESDIAVNAVPSAALSAACPCILNPTTGRLHWTWPCARALARTGLVTGFLSGMLGVGGGFIIVPSLGKHTNVPMQSIVATSLMVISLVSLVSIGSSALWNDVAWPVAGPFVLGAVASSLLLRVPARKIPPQWAARAFAVLCAGVAVVLLVRSFRALWV
jgi:uncharacterized protein